MTPDPSSPDSASANELGSSADGADGTGPVIDSDVVPLERGDCAVVISQQGGCEHLGECLESVLRHTPPEVTVVLADSTHHDSSVAQSLQALGPDCSARKGPVIHLRKPGDPSPVRTLNTALRVTDGADIVVVDGHCAVSEGWLDCLRDAASADATIATATALTNSCSMFSVPYPDLPSRNPPLNWTFEDVAAAIRNASLRIRPRIPNMIGHCAFIKRSAIELIGSFDDTLDSFDDAYVDFSQRCLTRGLGHVVADDVFVLHHTDGPLDEVSNATHRVHSTISDRYPTVDEQIHEVRKNRRGSLNRVVGVARRAITGSSVTIDATEMGASMSGTQRHTLEVIQSIAHQDGVRLRMVVSRALGVDVHRFLAGLDVETVSKEDAWRAPATDVVHRPYQLGDSGMLQLLTHLGDRLVITHHDLIMYRNPTYFPHWSEWIRYRAGVRTGLSLADAVVCVGPYVRQDLIGEGLTDPERTFVVPNGVDHAIHLDKPYPVPPASAVELTGERFLLCIGADYSHKNRLFALEVAGQLRAEHNWKGHLLLVGPHVEHGSSAAAESEYLSRNPLMRDIVHRMPAVSEAEKAWILERTDLMLYPTTVEGFGLVPFEAANDGIPCVFAPQGEMGGILPPRAAELVPWDAASTAANCARLLRDAKARRSNVSAIRAAGKRFTWERTGRELAEVYRATAEAPPRLSSDALARVPPTALGLELTGPSGLSWGSQAALMSLHKHPKVGGPVFAMLELGHRTGMRLSSLGRARHTGRPDR